MTRIERRRFAARERDSTQAMPAVFCWRAQEPRAASRAQAERAALLALVALASGCSPTQFALQERATERAIAQAHAEGAELRASYEYVLAQLYLDKAREESGQAHYAWALELLDKSAQTARRAYSLSVERARTPLPGTSR